MKNNTYKIFLILLLSIVISLFASCEKYSPSDEINTILLSDDLSIEMEVQTDSGNYIIDLIDDTKEDDYLRIDVEDEFSLRGEADIVLGNTYKLTVTMQNIDADPIILYSFWKKPITSLRHFTFNGEGGNPPSSSTQEANEEWVTFEETFETLEGEDSLMITLLSGKGTFLLKAIVIEKVN